MTEKEIYSLRLDHKTILLHFSFNGTFPMKFLYYQKLNTVCKMADNIFSTITE